MPKKTRKRKIVTKDSKRITMGSGLDSRKKYKYPFDDLKKAGDFFIVTGLELENSIRSQASKNQKSRGVRYQVSRVHKGQELSDGTEILKEGVVVRFDSYVS